MVLNFSCSSQPSGATRASRRDPARSSAPARGRGPGAGETLLCRRRCRRVSRQAGPQQTCCAACHGRWAPPAPPQPHNNMAAAASAGSRGGGEASDERAGTARPPVRPAWPRGTDAPPWGAQRCVTLHPPPPPHPGNREAEKA